MARMREILVIQYDVQGAKEARDEMEAMAERLHGRPITMAMRRAALLIERDAKRFAPVDTGRLRSSITHTVRSAGLFTGATIQGVIGTNVVYAPHLEFGTGVFAGRPRHRMPPVSALEGWARRHGTSAFVVALSIARRGGLKPHEYFKRSVDKNTQKVIDIIGDGVKLAIR